MSSKNSKCLDRDSTVFDKHYVRVSIILSSSILNWLPCVQEAAENESSWTRFKMSTERLWLKFLGRMSLWFFMAVLVALNAFLFVNRFCQFEGMKNVDGSGPNVAYMMARACGKNTKWWGWENQVKGKFPCVIPYLFPFLFLYLFRVVHDGQSL